jgi:hypothetical protein
MTTPGSCTHCNLVAGYQVSAFGVCVEICGDGLDFGGYECDDGNSLDGDG